MVSEGLLDTSAIIGMHEDRPLDVDRLPERMYVSAITLAELEVGVHRASDAGVRRARMQTWAFAGEYEVLDTNLQVASEWALLYDRLITAKRRLPINDLWIAAIALANNLPVVTQGDDFDALSDLGGPHVIKV